MTESAVGGRIREGRLEIADWNGSAAAYFTITDEEARS